MPSRGPGPGVDLNADLGEDIGPDADDRALLDLVTSASGASGVPAGAGS